MFLLSPGFFPTVFSPIVWDFIIIPPFVRPLPCVVLCFPVIAIVVAD